ncbi:Protein of unknown function, partial [Gryllus bimaculatus]
ISWYCESRTLSKQCWKVARPVSAIGRSKSNCFNSRVAGEAPRRLTPLSEKNYYATRQLKSVSLPYSEVSSVRRMLGDNARVNTTIVVSTAAALVAAAVVTTWWQRRRRESGRMPTKWRRVGELAELRIYPLKSGASLTLKEAECTDIGVRTTGDEAVFYCNK